MAVRSYPRLASWVVRITGQGASEILFNSLRQLTYSNTLPLPKIMHYLKFCSISSHLLTEGRIIMTGISYYLVLATSMTLESNSTVLRFPKTSNYSFLSGSMAPVFITTESTRSAFITLRPWSPLNVAVIPITLYLLRRRIAERNLFSIIRGRSAKNKESISSINKMVFKGILPVRTSE